jgi:hypothetical protein
MIRSILRAVLSAILLVGAAGGAQAQLTVVSSSPVDGQLNVPTNAILQIQFSAPLDTTARFWADENFYLAFETSPEIPTPALAGVSDDFTSFFAYVQLEPDTQYMVLVQGAKSHSGDILSRPYVVNFTTGTSLPTGSISGTITETGSGKAADGTLVAIFPDDPVNGIFGEGDGNLFGAAVANASGQFTINYVPDGSYQVASAGDANQDGLLEPENGDTFGLHDFDGDGLLDPVEVAGGGAVSGVNVTVKVPTPVSAKTNLPRATPIATSIYSDAQLVLVNGLFGNGGLSPQWTYVYYSPSNLTHSALFSMGDQFVLSPYQDFGGGADLTEPLPADFLDSDVVAATADENGGSVFISTYQDVEVFGFGGNVTDSFGSGKREVEKPVRSRGPFDISYPRGMGLSARSANAGLVTPTPVWIVSYYGYSEDFPYFGYLNVIIHAVTGEVDPALAYYTAAMANLDVANAAALSWSPNAELVAVQSGDIGVHRSGLSSEWKYTYFSSGVTEAYEVRVQEGVILFEGFPSLGFLRSTQALPENWLDSPGASSTADTESGNFRSQYPRHYVEAQLSREIVPTNPQRTVWQFQYWDNDSGFNVIVLVDAETGLVVGTDDDVELPSALRLDQNYPNPFNPSTSISYEVPSNGLVRLTIFDLLGREVRMMVEGEQAAGRYVASWDGMDDNGKAVSSGIYVYRIEAAGISETRSMTLLR